MGGKMEKTETMKKERCKRWVKRVTRISYTNMSKERQAPEGINKNEKIEEKRRRSAQLKPQKRDVAAGPNEDWWQLQDAGSRCRRDPMVSRVPGSSDARAAAAVFVQEISFLNKLDVF